MADISTLSNRLDETLNVARAWCAIRNIRATRILMAATPYARDLDVLSPWSALRCAYRQRLRGRERADLALELGSADSGNALPTKRRALAGRARQESSLPYPL